MLKHVDAVVIGTWPSSHRHLVVAALQAGLSVPFFFDYSFFLFIMIGKHVLCEARMAMNAQEAHEMLR
jgi:predicted dehydrogenase